MGVYSAYMELGAPIVAALLVMLVSFAGVIFASQTLSHWMRSHLTYLASFSGGVFLMVVYHLLEETMHESGSIALAAGAVLFGAALMEALHHLLPAEHHHHALEHTHAHTAIDGRRVLLSDALHNVGDGVLLVAAFATSWWIGVTATIGILVHEFVQEISEFFVLKEAGYSTQEALSRNFLSSSTILLGVGLAAFLSSSEAIAVLFGGVAAGGFIAVLLRDLMPHAIESVRERGGAMKHVAAFILGIALMFGVQTYFSHEEGADEARGGEITSSPQTQGILN